MGDSIRPEEAHQKYRELHEKDLDVLYQNRSFWEHRNCPLCSHSKGNFLFEKGPTRYETCPQCTLVYLNPCLKSDILENYYQNSVSAAFFHEHILQSSHLLRQEKLFKPRWTWLKEQLSSYEIDSCLDLGASVGSFLDVLQTQGVKAHGYEPNRAAAYLAQKQGLQVCSDRAELESVIAHESLDLITAWEVMAHLLNPIVFLKEVFKLLKPGGFFILTTPNIESLEYALLGSAHPNLVFPFLQLFSVTTLPRLIQALGLKLVLLETPGHMDTETIKTFLQSKPDWVPFLQARLTGETSEDIVFQNKIQEALVDLGLSGHMRLITQKV